MADEKPVPDPPTRRIFRIENGKILDTTNNEVSPAHLEWFMKDAQQKIENNKKTAAKFAPAARMSEFANKGLQDDYDNALETYKQFHLAPEKLSK